MKKWGKIILIILIIVTGSIGLAKLAIRPIVNVKDKNWGWDVKHKGLKGAMDFSFGEKGEFYIAFGDKIQCIYSDGKSKTILQDKNMKITSLVYYKDNIYFATDMRVFKYSLKDGTVANIINNIPNVGDYKESKISIINDELYVSIGAATNSGVVGEDNIWIKNEKGGCDISPIDIILRGTNFKNDTTGAFVPYNTKNKKGDKIKGYALGNGSVVRYNLNSKKLQLFAWGVRNITAMDSSSNGRIYAIVGGMEDRGLRAVNGDKDYVYWIENGQWYGWPDFSGGDPITSPRFKGNNLSFLMEKHPTESPLAPIYQHSSVSTLQAMAIDKYSTLGEKDYIYIYDKGENNIYSFGESTSAREVVRLQNGEIKSMKFEKSGLLVLDSKNGFIYEIKKIDLGKNISNHNNYIYGIIIAITSILLSLAYKTFSNK